MAVCVGGSCFASSLGSKSRSGANTRVSRVIVGGRTHLPGRARAAECRARQQPAPRRRRRARWIRAARTEAADSRRPLCRSRDHSLDTCVVAGRYIGYLLQNLVSRRQTVNYPELHRALRRSDGLLLARNDLDFVSSSFIAAVVVDFLYHSVHKLKYQVRICVLVLSFATVARH